MSIQTKKRRTPLQQLTQDRNWSRGAILSLVQRPLQGLTEQEQVNFSIVQDALNSILKEWDLNSKSLGIEVKKYVLSREGCSDVYLRNRAQARRLSKSYAKEIEEGAVKITGIIL